MSDCSVCFSHSMHHHSDSFRGFGDAIVAGTRVLQGTTSIAMLSWEHAPKLCDLLSSCLDATTQDVARKELDALEGVPGFCPLLLVRVGRRVVVPSLRRPRLLLFFLIVIVR